MPSRNDNGYYTRRRRRKATWSYRANKVEHEIKTRIERLAKFHRLRARALVKRFYTSSEVEIRRWLECERKFPFPSAVEAEEARYLTKDGDHLQIFVCGWDKSHLHLGHPKGVEHRENVEVRAIRDLIERRRNLLQEAS